MCGIVGYIGKEDALPIIIAGLEKLEYRGYDSAGVAIYEGGKVVVSRALGKLSELKKALKNRPANEKANIGIGHTRWATHGRPTENNAHPHTAGRVSLIHNGIIENYIELRERLQQEGAIFKSETDTEIGAHLLNSYLAKGQDPYTALKSMCADIRGSYAFVALDTECPDRLLVAKNSTPIIVGIADNAVFVASDIPAVLSHTRNILILEDGDIADVRIGELHIENHGVEVRREIQKITWDPITAQKSGYKHYMLKEIFEQGRVTADTFRARLDLKSSFVDIPEVKLTDAQVKEIKRVVLVACGTAWHACLVAKFYIESMTQLPCEVDYASEFRYRDVVLDKNTLVIAISQSGETLDTLAAIELASKSAETLAICNVLGSSITRKVKNVVYTHAGPEISVASTKAFTTQLVAVYMLSLLLAQKRGVLKADKAEEYIGALIELPGVLESTLSCSAQLEKISGQFYRARDFLFLGRGILYPIALEGALKLKEISYIHAEGYPAGEMKHGPIALIDDNMPVVVLLPKGDVVFEKTLSNLKEVESRQGKIIAITDTRGHKELRNISSSVVEIPHLSSWLTPILFSIPMQLLAYHMAVLNGRDVDLPRNLAKSVTVE